MRKTLDLKDGLSRKTAQLESLLVMSWGGRCACPECKIDYVVNDNLNPNQSEAKA